MAWNDTNSQVMGVFDNHCLFPLGWGGWRHGLHLGCFSPALIAYLCWKTNKQKQSDVSIVKNKRPTILANETPFSTVSKTDARLPNHLKKTSANFELGKVLSAPNTNKKCEKNVLQTNIIMVVVIFETHKSIRTNFVQYLFWVCLLSSPSTKRSTRRVHDGLWVGANYLFDCVLVYETYYRGTTNVCPSSSRRSPSTKRFREGNMEDSLRFGPRTSAHFLSCTPFFARPRHKISSMFPAGMLAVTGCKSLKRPLLYYMIS